MLTNKLKNRFIKESGSSVHIIKEPYFSYLVDLYDETDKLTEFEKLVSIMNGEQGYFDYTDNILMYITQFVKTQSEYLQFANCEMSKYKSTPINCKNFYSTEYVGKYYITIDLKEAGFQALKYAGVNVFNQSTFSDFIKHFTTHEWFWKSRQFRQVVLGNLNPKRQTTIVNYLIEQMYIAINPIINDSKSKVIKSCADEIIIECFDYNEFYLIHKIEKSLKSIGLNVHIDFFKLNEIKTNYDLFYVKEFDYSIDIENGCSTSNNKDYSFKSVNKQYMPQLLKLYTNQPIEEYDLYFENNRILSKFVEPLKLQ